MAALATTVSFYVPFDCAIAAVPAAATGPANGTGAGITSSQPIGFETLLEPQRMVVDLYYHGEAIGQVAVWVSPGGVRFDNIDAVLAKLPDVAATAAVRAALANPLLQGHADLVCESDDAEDSTNCGRLPTDQTGVIFDQRHFRIDVFVAASMLAVRRTNDELYLTPSSTAPALVGFVSGTLAGSSGRQGYSDYNVQTRLIASVGEARLRAETSIGSGYGAVLDTVVAELDRPGVRYSAGDMWVPGIDLTGRRKIVGIGVRSQLDTRVDRDILIGSPLIVSLLQRSRVDILRDGRLVSSRIYDAGNQTLDTSAMPDGSYEVVLRIQEAGGHTREERRFFSKNAAIPAIGQSVFFAYGGLLADTGPREFLSVTKTPYLQVGGARRLRSHVAADVNVIATDKTVIGEAGTVLLSREGQIRIAGLVSARGDAGVIVQANSSGLSRLNYSIDARKVWSSGNRGLLPAPAEVLYSLDRSASYTDVAIGSFAEASGNVSYRVGHSQIGLSASYRQYDKGERYYAVGPTATVPILQRQGLQLYLRGDATVSNRGTAAFVGFSVTRIGVRSSLSADAGVRSTSGASSNNGTAIVGGVSASWQRDDLAGADVAVAGGVDHDVGTTVARGRVDVATRVASFYADVLQPLSHDRDNSGATQFSTNATTSFSIGAGKVAFDGRRHDDSTIIVAVDGTDKSAPFDVFVDGSPRGTVRAGGALAVSVQSYRRYAVRISPTGESLVRLDGGTRQVNVYPGSVARARWQARSVLAVFGRLVWADGSPVADAAITAPGEIAQSDDHGFFQVEASTDAEISARTSDGRTCRASLRGATVDNYSALGVVRCIEPLPPIIIASSGEKK